MTGNQETKKLQALMCPDPKRQRSMRGQEKRWERDAAVLRLASLPGPFILPPLPPVRLPTRQSCFLLQRVDLAKQVTPALKRVGREGSQNLVTAGHRDEGLQTKLQRAQDQAEAHPQPGSIPAQLPSPALSCGFPPPKNIPSII